MSRDTWDPAGGESISTNALADLVVGARDDVGLAGVTISGGEPFQQPAALADFLDLLREKWPGADILVYSGYSLETLRRGHADLLARIDAVLTGPFVARQTTDAQWRGSSNQVLTVLNPALENSYIQRPSLPSLQVGVDETAVWVTGIPRRGDLERLRSTLAGAGLVLEDVSWLG
jgi:anaerobic ribonucleoside-triphosphate reductase activating protein